MLVSLLTPGCPEQLSGGYLYHCRLAELAGDHDAEVEFVPVRLWPDPFTLAHGDVLLVDSIAAWLVAPWAQRAANPAAGWHRQQRCAATDPGRARPEPVPPLRAADRGQRVAARGPRRPASPAARRLHSGHRARERRGGHAYRPGTRPAPRPPGRGRQRDNWMARKGVLALLDALGRLAVLGDRVVHPGVLDRTASPASTPAPTSSCCPAGGNRTARSTARPWPLACRSLGGGLATCLTSSATESREWSSTRAISRPSPPHSTGWPATSCGGPPWRGRRAAESLRCRDGATPRQHSSRSSRS